MNADQRLPLSKLSGAGAKVGDSVVWTGTAWIPGPGSSLIPVLHGDPSSPAEGQLWFDLDATC